MFCMGCGAEASSNADRCLVCGRDLARLPGDSSASSHERPSALTSSPADEIPNLATTPPAPSIYAGQLDTPGLPRDAIGRALLITVLAMMLDLLAPWINQLGRRIAPADVGAPILLAVIALAAALLPLSRTSLRRQPPVAMLPIVIGSVAFGATGLVWLSLAITSLSGSQTATTVDVSAGTSVVLAPVADFGLYLFLFGAGILVYTGYQMFLAAARSGLNATTTDVSAPALTPEQRGLLLGDGAEVLDSTDGDLPARTAAQETSTPIAATPQPAPQPAISASAAPNGLALPGMASWSNTPPPPPGARPSSTSGWRRLGSPRHP